MADRPNGRRTLPPRASPSSPPRPGPAVPSALGGELQAALEDALTGRLAHEHLAPTLQREARAILLRWGLGAADVVVAQEGGTCRVEVRLPARAPVVLRLRVDVG